MLVDGIENDIDAIFTFQLLVGDSSTHISSITKYFILYY